MSRSKINAVAYISPQNHPILVHSFVAHQDDLKYHYVAHTSLDVIEERMASTKLGECFLGHLFSMEDLAVYGYLTPSRIKIVVALALTDAVIRDIDVITVFKALHLAYFQALSNPFLTLNTPPEALLDHASLLTASKMGSRGLARRVEAIGKAINTPKAQEQ